MRWSPYASEVELLKQFNDIGWHGTKVIVFNLWLNDDGILELDFDSDEHDIQLRVGSKDKPGKQVNLPTTAYTRAHCEPLPASSLRTSVITTIGFTKEAPMVNVHGFNVYHKNRLIMPFWKVFQDNSSRGRGVVGKTLVFFGTFVKKSGFLSRTAGSGLGFSAFIFRMISKTSNAQTVFLRLEARLKAMTIEYWNLHCHLIGYQSSADKRNRQDNAASGDSSCYSCCSGCHLFSPIVHPICQ
ncbi:unnamed protein product [Sphagnum tenellum]